jgi:hypothetical protein
MSVDPANRSPRFWEVMFPSPPPGVAAADDPRIAIADGEWRQINAKLPKWLSCHPYNDMLGSGLPECERTWAFDFRALSPTAWWRIPVSIGPGRLPADPVAQYRIHEMMLQALQFGSKPATWVLKGFHGGRLSQLFARYPDARVLYIHRDPIPVLASRVQMCTMLYEGLTGRTDSGEHAAQHRAAGIAAFRAATDSPHLDDPRIHHVRYQDFLHDRVGTIADFYRFADRSLSDAARTAMERYLAQNRGDRYGKFRYDIASLGDVDALNEEFALYRQRFGVVQEAP